MLYASGVIYNAMHPVNYGDLLYRFHASLTVMLHKKLGTTLQSAVLTIDQAQTMAQTVSTSRVQQIETKYYTSCCHTPYI